MRLIVNIPAYNEEDKIAETIGRIRSSFGSEFYRTGSGSALTEKLIQLIDDGSTDATVARAKEAGADLIVSYRPNRRLAYAFKRSVENALEHGADFMVNIDADGQFDPEDIPKLIEPVLAGSCDMTVANRFGDIAAKDIPWIRSFLNRFAASMVGFFLNVKTEDLTCGFRAHSRETLLRLNLVNVNFTYTQETIIDAIGKNLKIRWIPIRVTYHADRKPKITKSVTRFVSNGFKIILKAVRDVRPMKFFGIPGLFMIGISVVLFVAFLVSYLQDLKISPYRNYLSFAAIFFVVGLQFVVFALLADMVKSNRLLIEEQLYLSKKRRYDSIEGSRSAS
ncbi:MAG: glycosyltransferase family 2 protein [Candidatus Moranbacteria bacterium]|nr:glycosyltransferase family 2 protein [Candidatus Moranbacteria bacterium]NTW45542.1 glycosyltransferase family 2 protein [Candidatus Moranbacteria bacterium]